MVQVWLIDKQGFYQNESKFVEETSENMTTVPLLVGYIKPKLVNADWVEGATEEEIQEWKDKQPKPSLQIPIERLVSNLIIDIL